MEYYWWFPILGLAIGTFGTLIGAGGGFLLMPILLFLYPDKNPVLLTSISLGVVFLNAFSGSIAYARLKRIDYRAGILFSIATIPGAILGTQVTGILPRGAFDRILGAVLFCIAAYLLYSSFKAKMKNGADSSHDASGSPIVYNKFLGIALSVAVGFFSSLLGIGGGIIHVPALIYLLHFPPHRATATSHFVLASMAFVATVVNYMSGSLEGGISSVLALGAGVIIGAQIGAKISHHVSHNLIVRSLAIALCSVGLRFLFS